MEYGKIDEPHFVVCLEGGDEIHDSLVAFVEKEHITFGMIQGIGTVREVTLGFFHPDRKEYRETKLYGIKEIISLTGTLDMFQKKPYGHFNIALGGEVAIHRAAIWSRASSELPPKSLSPVLTRSSCGRRTNPWALICGNYPKRRNLRYNFIVKSWGNLFCSSFFLLFFIFSH